MMKYVITVAVLLCRCEVMERLVQLVIQDDEADSDTLAALGHCLCGALRSTWSHNIFPTSVTPDSIGELASRLT